MPLFTVEQNRIADDFTSSTWTVYLHTASPSDSQPANARTTTGGGAYASGQTVAAGDFSVAATGDVQITAAIDFGSSTAAVGTVTHWSAYRSGSPVAYGTSAEYHHRQR